MRVEILGKSRREYRRADGSRGVAHNLSVLLETGEVGQLWISEEVFAAVPTDYRGPAELVFGSSVFRGDVRPRVVTVRLLANGQAK
jgi:hypothetical protein